MKRRVVFDYIETLSGVINNRLQYLIIDGFTLNVITNC